MMVEFVHTHTHSDFSLLDSSISAENLAKDAAAKGMKSLCLTDHGNVMGHVDFFAACKKYKIKPVLGCELYVARRSALEDMDKIGGNPTDHLVVHAETQEGYRNLLQLVTWARKNGFNYVPRVGLEQLAQHSKGLIAQTACLSGGVNRLLGGWQCNSSEGPHIFAPAYEEGRDLACKLRDIFGPENFFLEVQHHVGDYQDKDLVDRQEFLINQVLRLHNETGIPLIATNDIHFRQPKDARAREIALYISRGKTKKDTHSMDLVSHTGEFYVKSPEEMLKCFGGLEGALKNTLIIPERCNVSFDLDSKHFARPIDGTHELTDEEVEARWENLLAQGFHHKYGDDNDAAMQRLLYEKKVIEKMGFISYFLIVADFISYARSRGIPVGPGRGSVAGSLVAYVLDITRRVDPLEYSLFFERFLNPERISLPDIDVDFCKDRVHEVREYIVNKYGKDRVARIGSVGALWAKGVIREVGKILDLPVTDIDDWAKAIPYGGGEFQVSIADAMGKGNPDLMVPKIRGLMSSSDPMHREFIEICENLEGIKRSITTHACGIVISDKPLLEYVALSPIDDSDLMQTACDMGAIEKLGLVKMDLLSLDTLTVIARAIKWIKERHGIQIDIDEVPLNDAKVYDLICSGRTLGMFQIETDLMRPSVLKMQPRSISDISALVSLIRPGPLDYIDSAGLSMVDHYMLRRNNREPVDYIHPKFEPILKDTYGIIIYQEQIMQIASVLCGYSMAEADNLRKGIGKKLPELVAQLGQKFIPAAVKHSGITTEEATHIWEFIEPFARYGFNKAHSDSYSIITYYSAWLKTYYPVEFMASVLTKAIGSSEELEADTKTKNNEDVIKYIYECEHIGVPIYDPDICKSEALCVPELNGVRAGLKMVKGVGDSSALVVAARSMLSGKFENFDDMIYKCCLMGVKRNTIDALIRAGCVTFAERALMLRNLDNAINRAKVKIKKAETEAEEKANPPAKPKRKRATKAEIGAALLPCDPMDPEIARAESLEAIGVYLLPKFPTNQIFITLYKEEGLLDLIRLLKTYTGSVKTFARVRKDNVELDLSLPGNNGSDDFISEVWKLGRLKEG